MRPTSVNVYAGFPQSFGVFDPGAFDPGAFDLSPGAGQITVYAATKYRVRLTGTLMPDRFYIKRNDVRPDLIAELLNPNHTPVDLTSATEIRLLAYGKLGDDAPATVLDTAVQKLSASAGLVRHTWNPAQTAKHGRLDAEFQIKWSDGSIQTWPNEGYFLIDIGEDLNPMPAVPEDLQFVWSEAPSGTIDGTDGTDGNSVFTLAQAPDPSSSLRLIKNGQELKQGVGYTLVGNQITYVSGYIPIAGMDSHWAHYVYDAAA